MERGVLLLSGGLDSPVAGHEAQERGLDLVALHFLQEATAGPESLEKAVETAEKLGTELYAVNADEPFMTLTTGRHKLYFVLQKRLMLRVAERLARREDASFLVTGENLGQVSSQTTWNMGVVDQAVDLPVVRPLLTMEKNEIVDKAREIGTFEISSGPEHCDALGPDHPRTRVSLDDVLEEEEDLGMDELVEECFSGLQRAKKV